MKVFRLIIFLVVIPLYTVFLSTVLPLLFYKFDWFPEKYRKILKTWSHFILWGLSIDVKISKSDRAKLLPGDPEIIISSHHSHLDSLILWTVLPHKTISFVAKESLFKIPILSSGLKAAGAICINRKTGSKAMTQIRDALASNERRSILIYPEGTRTPSGTIKKFKNGAFVIAKQSGRSIISLCLLGTGDLYSKKQIVPHAGIVEVKVIDRVPVKAIKEQSVDDVSRSLWDAMNEIEVQYYGRQS